MLAYTYITIFYGCVDIKHMIQHITTLVLLLIINTTAGQEVNYCKLNCGSLKHTMCRYQPGPAKECGDHFNSSLSETEKQDILRVHNKYRSKIASGKEEVKWVKLPGAADMMELEWDKELEQIALRLSEQCFTDMQHDTCRDSERFPVGQNLARSSNKVHSETLVLITAWYDEVKLFHLHDGVYDGYRDFSISHFTQVVWAKSQFIGCARVIWKNQQQLTCNYGPAGNFHQSIIYKTGAPCSECPDGSICSPRYSSLCTYKHGSASSILLYNHYSLTSTTSSFLVLMFYSILY